MFWYDFKQYKPNDLEEAYKSNGIKFNCEKVSYLIYNNTDDDMIPEYIVANFSKTLEDNSDDPFIEQSIYYDAFYEDVVESDGWHKRYIWTPDYWAIISKPNNMNILDIDMTKNKN